MTASIRWRTPGGLPAPDRFVLAVRPHRVCAEPLGHDASNSLPAKITCPWRTRWWSRSSSTARIGADDDPEAVLDGDLRVRGVPGPRVVDASVFPDIPGLFIASAVYLISEKATAALLTEHPAGPRRPPW